MKTFFIITSLSEILMSFNVIYLIVHESNIRLFSIMINELIKMKLFIKIISALILFEFEFEISISFFKTYFEFEFNFLILFFEFFSRFFLILISNFSFKFFSKLFSDVFSKELFK